MQTKRNNSADSNSNSYNQGYQDGRVAQHNQQVKKNRDNNGVFIGLLLGVSFTIALGLVFALSNTLSSDQRNETETTQPTEELNQPEQSQQEDTTIIERTVEKTQEVVPVPQNSSPSPSESNTNLEINIPNPLNQDSSGSQPSENSEPVNSAEQSTQTEDNSTNQSSDSNAQ